ncbi:MAG: glycosyltransferase [Myxococcota bacterium]
MERDRILAGDDPAGPNHDREPRGLVPLRVGLLTTSYPRSHADHAGVFVRGFAEALVDRGHTVEVIAPEPREGSLVKEPKAGIEVHWVPYLRPRSLQRTFYGAGTPENVARDPRSWPGLVSFPPAALRAVHQRGRHWDALVSHWALPSTVLGGLCRAGRPHLGVFHSADLHLIERFPGRRTLASRIARFATSLLFVTRDHRARFLSLLSPLARAEAAGRCHVSPMGVEPAPPPSGDRRALRPRLGLRGLVVLSIGRLVPIKGLDIAVRALRERANCSLVAAGTGPETSRLRRLADDCGVDLRLVGPIHGQEKERWLEAADVFVVPSRSAHGREEGVPHAMLEALLRGLPTVASHTGGIGEVLDHDRTGLLVPTESPEALGNAFDLLRDRNLRRRLGRGATRLGEQYLWTAIAPHLEELLLDETAQEPSRGHPD